MARTQIQIGSQGADVEYLQELLNKNGYKLDVDGIFGEQTLSAVKDYQQKNGLDVDGIVGVNTWGKLDGNGSSGNDGFTYKKFTYDDFDYDDYKEGESVKSAENALSEHLKTKPGEYNSQWQTQLDDVMNKILNREDFSYDFNKDALYQQYKDKSIKQGKMAMADTMGQASAMTGGYGNSYAATAGNQAYQAHLENLNDVIPELYQMAYDRYNQKGQDLYNQYGLISDRENTDYGRYRDSVADFNTERDYLTGRYDTERNFDYGKWNDQRTFDYGVYSDNRTLAHGEHTNSEGYRYNNYRDAIADDQFDRQMTLEEEKFDWQKKNTNVTDDYTSGSDYTGGNDNTGGGNDTPVVSLADSPSVQSFMNALSPKSAHDTIQRQMYGTYNGYVAAMLAVDKTLTADEKAWIMNYYGVTETDMDYAENAKKQGKRGEDTPVKVDGGTIVNGVYYPNRPIGAQTYMIN